MYFNNLSSRIKIFQHAWAAKDMTAIFAFHQFSCSLTDFALLFGQGGLLIFSDVIIYAQCGS
jgi:hypothetical protein